MKKRQAWVISVDMGYGHQRAAYPLKDIAYERIITANSDKIITPQEGLLWERLRFFYEGISRFRSTPLIGEFLWKLVDYLESITSYYPFRDLSRPSIGTRLLHWYIKKGFLKSIVEYSKNRDIPFFTTFFAPAIAAAHFNRKNVYCLITDTDLNRVWVPENPEKDRIFYLSPTEQATKRLMEYGVPKKDIFFTGFPLPKENTGRNMEILRRDIGERLPNLDPKKVYTTRYKTTIKKVLGREYRTRSRHPLTLTFVVGGAGAQTEIGSLLLESLRKSILKHRIRVNIIAGTRLETAQYFKNRVAELKLFKEYGKYVNILFALNKAEHFSGFNNVLHATDILWTKPSELSFYCALGLPVIIAPPLGSHEIMNKEWLMMMGSGIPMKDPKYTDEWLFDWINRGLLAEAAWQGFTEAPRYGTYNIEKAIFSERKSKLKFRY